MARPKKNTKQPKAIASAQSLSAFVKSICDIMRRSNCASALQYVPELTWILFLRILDEQETRAQEEAETLGAEFSPAPAQSVPLAGLGRAVFRQTRPSNHDRRQALGLEATGAFCRWGWQTL